MHRRLLPIAVCWTILTAVSSAAAEEKIDPWLADRLASGGSASFLVLFDTSEGLRSGLAHLAGAADPGRATYDHLRHRARTRQREARAWLAAHGIRYRSLYIVNGLQIEGDVGLARALAARPEVVRIVGDPKVRGLAWFDPVAGGTDGIEWGVLNIKADQVWSLDGNRGAGIVVASADTGVEWTHPAIQAKYRGWNGSGASHDYNWYDAVLDLPVPLDDHDHGTHTTGTMVGDDGAGNQIGVAPDARWIACRNMDHGIGQPSTYLGCNQFFLAPWPHGGDPELDGDPSKRPDIVNNSWGCPPSEGCDALVLEDSFLALEQAGILAVASAGNSGPNCSTVSDPPPIYEAAFAVGAIDSANALASFSSRGPVTVDGSNRLRPDVAAPGVSVRSAVRGNGYASFSGTSMAGPHVAGATALLWSVKPQVRNLLRISRCLISRTANPIVGIGFPQSCGGTSRSNRPNNLFGWGRIDIYNAIHFTPDGDADGIADACDCASANPGTYDAPGEVTGLVFDAGKSTLTWDSLARQAGNGTAYDAIRGSLAELAAAGGSIAGAACLPAPGTLATLDDATTPAPESGFYYLVQARNACGTGGWGAASSGTTRAHANCP